MEQGKHIVMKPGEFLTVEIKDTTMGPYIESYVRQFEFVVNSDCILKEIKKGIKHMDDVPANIGNLDVEFENVLRENDSDGHEEIDYARDIRRANEIMSRGSLPTNPVRALNEAEEELDRQYPRSAVRTTNLNE